MDLLRQILARLPLRALIAHNILDDQMIRTRTTVVNRLSESIDSASKDKYITICIYQGELVEEAISALPKSTLCARAAFLQDSAFHHRIDLNGVEDHVLTNAEMAIRNGIEVLESSDIIDPQSIQWTPDLIARCARLPTWGSAEAFLAGYLQLSTPKIDAFNYNRGYITRMMETDPDPFPSQSLADIERKLGPSLHYGSLVSAGYCPSTIFANFDSKDLMSYAATYIQPDLMRRLPYSGKGSLRMLHQEMPGIGYPITIDVVRRAREMLSLVREKCPEELTYISVLRVIVGLRIDCEKTEYLTNLMNDVAHPQLTTDLIRFRTLRSLVYYDLPNYFIAAEEKILDHDRRFDILFASGQLLKVMRGNSHMYTFLESMRSGVMKWIGKSH